MLIHLLVNKKMGLLFLESQSSVLDKLYLQVNRPEMRVGFIIKSPKGSRCRVKVRCSRVWVGGSSRNCVEMLPRWVIKNM